MSNLAEKLFEGLAEAAKEGISNAGPQIGAELKQMGAHGAHELAAALFSGSGSGFVMYPRGTRDDHGVHGPEQAQEMAKDGQEQEQQRGRSM